MVRLRSLAFFSCLMLILTLPVFSGVENSKSNIKKKTGKSTIIHISWEGPFTLDQAIKKLDDKKVDYGVYQIYGRHPVYGRNALLYIGKASERTFSSRFKEHKDYWLGNDGRESNTKIYVGRLCGKRTPGNKEWSNLIGIAEELLIYSHWSAGNSSGLNKIEDKNFYNIHILNWGNRRDLLPEVSGHRWTDKFNFEKPPFSLDSESISD